MFVSKVARYNFFGPKKLQVLTARVSIMEAFVKFVEFQLVNICKTKYSINKVKFDMKTKNIV